MEKTELIKAILVTIIGSGAFSTLLSHFLYNAKLNKELKFKGKEIQIREIEESLRAFRDLELLLTVQEIYNIEEELSERGAGVNMFGGECIYLEVFNDWESFDEFTDKIDECRTKYEKYMSCRIALNLVFIDKYMRQVGLFMAGDEEMLPFWGTIFIIDLQSWQMKIDRLLIKEMNRHSYKLESHETKKWSFLRKYELERQYESTILYYLQTGKCRKRDYKRMTELEAILNEIFE